uniref:tRNA threonylcarbamoyladenosine dehydratase isoform X1 n=1 Tax=Rhizophora mucronata TaxID=61149 RepID=A0A2P2KR98_RHIMU
MEERLKCAFMVGAGAVLGSISTFALLKLLPRRIASQCTKRSTELNAVQGQCEFPFASCMTAKYGNRGMPALDILRDEIVSEQLTRNIQFFGPECQQKVTASYVVVIGLGGVGSHAASMLLRSGVGKLLLVDFDQMLVFPKPSVSRNISLQSFQSAI